MGCDYFYGVQADQFTFYRVPKLFFIQEQYSNMPTDAKLLYGMLLDRMNLSARNGWLDEKGRVYIIYPIEEIMLTKPKAGWSDFQLTGTSVYGLSYIIGDLPFDWIEQVIHGLETWNPFCVTANLEPGCFICVVGYHNCHIIVEEDEWSHSSQEEEISTEMNKISFGC